MIYIATWEKYQHGRNYEAHYSQQKKFENLEEAISFICKKEDKTNDIYWAGAHIDDENGNTIYIITSNHARIRRELKEIDT